MTTNIEDEDIKIYYFHGFGSGENSRTASALKEVYPQLVTLKYDTYDHDKAQQQFAKYFEGKRFDHTDLFIGTSLGGYWANRFCSQYGVQAILINPCLNPNEVLAKYDGQKVGYDGVQTVYHHKPNYVDAKHRVYPRVVFIGENDKILDSKYAVRKLKNHSKIVYLPNEGHQLKDLTPVIDMIPKVINNTFN